MYIILRNTIDNRVLYYLVIIDYSIIYGNTRKDFNFHRFGECQGLACNEQIVSLASFIIRQQGVSEFMIFNDTSANKFLKVLLILI